MHSKTLRINNSTITIKPVKFSGEQSIEYYEKLLYSALNKIGITANYISISKPTTNSCTISWKINSKKFSFTCYIFETYRENIGACVQAIQEDVRQILRGIKDIDLVLKQYEQTNGDEIDGTHNSSTILHFSNHKSNTSNEHEHMQDSFVNQYNHSNTLTQENTSTRQLTSSTQIINESHAKSIIEHIKEKYPQFSNFNYIPEEDKFLLEKAYLYLGKKPFWNK